MCSANSSLPDNWVQLALYRCRRFDSRAAKADSTAFEKFTTAPAAETKADTVIYFFAEAIAKKLASIFLGLTLAAKGNLRESSRAHISRNHDSSFSGEITQDHTTQ